MENVAPTPSDGGSGQARQDQTINIVPRVAPHVGFACRHERHATAGGGEKFGHSDTRMVERHYGHLAPSYIADAIRAGAPRFGFKANQKVASLAGRA